LALVQAGRVSLKSMTFRLKPWPAAVLVVLSCAAIVGALWYLRSVAPLDRAAMLRRLPANASVVAFADLEALRKAGLLELVDSSTAVEEAEYRSFVTATGFDYRLDLDHLYIAKANEQTYAVVTGRFNWASLSSYVASQNGICRFAFCRVPASETGKRVSFLPIRRNTMGFAAGSDEWAALHLSENDQGPPAAAPASAPVWFWFSKRALTEESLPDRLRELLAPVAGSERVTIALEPDGGRLVLHATVVAASADAARRIEQHLSAIGSKLRQEMMTARTPVDSSTLSGVLVSGKVEVAGDQVDGRWPVERAFLENLIGGKI
jgi:hypothetical protein